MNKKGIALFNLIIIIAIIFLTVIGCYFGFATLIINNKKDNFVNTAKTFVEGAKKQLMSDDMMPSSGEGVIIPYEQINLGKTYNSPYTKKGFKEDYSYVVIIKKAGEVKENEDEYVYYAAQIDDDNNCLNLINYNKIDNYGNKKRQYVEHDNMCNIQSILLVDSSFKLKDINLGYDVKYSKYEKIEVEIDKYK